MQTYTAEEAVKNLMSPKGNTVVNNWDKLKDRQYLYKKCSTCGEYYLAVDLKSPLCIGKSEDANETSAGDKVCKFCKDWIKFQVKKLNKD